MDYVFGFPNVARFSWQPVKNALAKKNAKVKWCVCVMPSLVWISVFKLFCINADVSTIWLRRDDEPATIQKYFSGKPAGLERPQVWKDFGLHSVGSF